MKPPRIFARGGYFWISYFLPGQKNDVRRTTNIELDLPAPGKRPDPDWWKKSRHARKLKNLVDDAAFAREARERGVMIELPSRSLNIWELLDEYNRERAVERDRDFSAKTLEHRRNAVTKLLQFEPNFHPYRATKDLVLEYRTWLKQNLASLHTALGYFNDVKAIMGYAKRAGYIPENPFEGVLIAMQEFETDPAPPTPLSMEDLKKVLAVAYVHRPHLYQHMMTILCTGIRVSQVANLRKEMVDLEKREFRYWNSKSKRYERYPISDALFEVWKDLGDHGEFLLPYRDKRTVNLYIEVACKIAGIDRFSSNSLRDTFASLIDPHADVRMMDRLMHHDPTVNVIAQKNYLTKDIARMREVLDIAFREVYEFVLTLPSLPKAAAPRRFARHRRNRIEAPSQ